MKKKLVSMLICVVMLGLFVVGCSSNSSDSEKKDEESTEDSSEELKTIKMGSGGIYTNMVDIIAEFMEKDGYKIELVTFDSNSGPADACIVDDIDAFIYNHEPWIMQYDEDKGADLKMVQHLYYGRAGLYSTKYDSLDDLPDGAQIAIPNDSTNMDNTLLFFQEIGLITLGEKTESFYTILDIVDNPKNIEFVETEITYTARSAEDCDAVVCTAMNAQEAGMSADSFLAENESKKDYPIGLTIREEDEDSQWVADMIEVLKSDEYKEAFNEVYKGTLVLFD